MGWPTGGRFWSEATTEPAVPRSRGPAGPVSPVGAGLAVPKARQAQGNGWAALRRLLERSGAGRVLVSAAEGFLKDRVLSHAAAMAYYGIFSLFSLALLFTSITAFVFGEGTGRDEIVGALGRLLPAGAGAQAALTAVVDEVVEARRTALGVGSAALLWSAFVWFQEIDTNVNEIWGVTRPRARFKRVLLAVSLLGAVTAIAVSSFVATGLIDGLAAAVGATEATAAGRAGVVALWQGLVSVLSVLTLSGLFYLLYRYLPRRRVQFWDAWPAALAMAVAWEVSRLAVSIYLDQVDVVRGYGSAGAALALLLWIYVASAVLLSGAELAYAIAKERRHISAEEEMPVVAPAGEQPTPKFAPQTGRGASPGA